MWGTIQEQTRLSITCLFLQVMPMTVWWTLIRHFSQFSDGNFFSVNTSLYCPRRSVTLSDPEQLWDCFVCAPGLVIGLLYCIRLREGWGKRDIGVCKTWHVSHFCIFCSAFFSFSIVSLEWNISLAFMQVADFITRTKQFSIVKCSLVRT